MPGVATAGVPQVEARHGRLCPGAKCATPDPDDDVAFQLIAAWNWHPQEEELLRPRLTIQEPIE